MLEINTTTLSPLLCSHSPHSPLFPFHKDIKRRMYVCVWWKSPQAAKYTSAILPVVLSESVGMVAVVVAVPVDVVVAVAVLDSPSPDAREVC
jgi:hypothetical protein